MKVSDIKPGETAWIACSAISITDDVSEGAKLSLDAPIIADDLATEYDCVVYRMSPSIAEQMFPAHAWTVVAPKLAKTAFTLAEGGSAVDANLTLLDLDAIKKLEVSA